MSNSIVMKNTSKAFKAEYKCRMLCDILNTEGAEVLAEYGSDFYSGKPVLTVNEFGKGKAYYIASDPETDFVSDFAEYLCRENSIKAPLEAEAGVEITQRFKEGKEFTFILNHNEYECTVDLKDSYLNLIKNEKVSTKLTLKAKDVAILERL